jgi:transcriptional regulator with XRE-family HTH domain
VATLREIRLTTGQSQRAFAALLEVPFQTYRPLDSGRRRTPTAPLDRAADIQKQHRCDTELFTIDFLARAYHIHPRTLRAAARDGRLTVHFSNRAVFGRPLRLATRGAVDDFVRRFYRQRYSRFAPTLQTVLPGDVPDNFASRLIGLRLRLRMTQGELARHIGAASKAVVYQWECRKRKPTIAFWRRIEKLMARSCKT